MDGGADRISYDEFVYGLERFVYDTGSSEDPRVAAVLRLAPKRQL